VREAGHDRVRVLRGEFRDAALQARQLRAHGVDGVAQVQADIRGHLVVARAPRVQLLAGVADQGREARLDVHVHVLALDFPGEFAAGDFLGHRARPSLDRRELAGAEHTDIVQHRAWAREPRISCAAMRDRSRRTR
jgi:hypothetical protein